MKTSLSQLTKDRVIGLVTVKPKITPPILKEEYILFQLTASLLDMAATQCLLKRKSKEFSKLGDCYQY
jgi:hypothetical protein